MSIIMYINYCIYLTFNYRNKTILILIVLELICYLTISLVYIVSSAYSLFSFLVEFSFMNKFFLLKKKIVLVLGAT